MTDDHLIREYAVLLFYAIDEDTVSRKIYFGSPESLFCELRGDLQNHLDKLVAFYSHDIGDEKVSSFFHEIDNSMQFDSWDAVRTMIISELESHQTAAYPIALPYIKSVWYQRIERLNKLFKNGDGVWIEIEGDLKSFSRKLLEREASGYNISHVQKNYSEPYDWLGRLAILSFCPDYAWDRIEERISFNKLVMEFNDHNK